MTYWPINKQHDVSERLLGVASVLADYATGTTEMAPHDVSHRLLVKVIVGC